MGLNESLSKIQGRFGKGAIMKMSDAPVQVERVSSGSLKLDIALGGGYAKGKIIEILSEEACGKTGRALELVKQVQQDGGIACYIDSEHALDEDYVKKLGVDYDELLLAQPSDGEEAFEIAIEMASCGEVDLIVFDSVSAMTPRAEIEGETGESRPALQARMMSQGCRKLTGVAARNKCTIFFINQLREKIGTYVPTKVGSGGNSLKFYATMRLEIKKSFIGTGEDKTGFVQKIKVIKNKTYPAFKKAEININYTTGVDVILELLDVAVDFNIVDKSGSWYNYGDVKLGQGASKSADLLRDNPELVEEIEQKVRKALES